MRRAVVRLLLSVPLLIVVTFGVFVMVDLAPGDPATKLAGEQASPERIAQIRDQLNLDDPLPVRYGKWLGDVVRGDLGQSLGASRTPVWELVSQKIPPTASITIAAIAASTLIAFALALASVARPRGVVDRTTTLFASAAIAAPSFWIGIVLVHVFALKVHWFPAVGYSPLADGFGEWLRSITLPAIALGALPGAELTLQLKASLAEVLHKDYIVTAHAKGLRRGPIVVKHALKNSLIPVVTVLGFRIAQLLGGSAAIEFVFNVRGVGWLAYDSALAQDVTVLLGIVVLSTLLVVVVNTAVDLSYAYFNPRLRRVNVVAGRPGIEPIGLPKYSRVVLRRFAGRRLSVLAAAFLLALVVVALFAPLLAPDDPARQDLFARLQPPSSGHWLGTDELGRDSLSRLIYGSRVSLLAAAEVVFVAAAVGVPLGLIAGFVRRWVDAVLSWFMDGLMSVPGLILALTLIGAFGRGLGKAMLIVGLLTAPRLYRVARSIARDVSSEAYIEASIAIGCTRRRVMLQHIFPNMVPTVVVQLAVVAGFAVVSESTLSLLGLGVEPGTPSWGGMLASASSNIRAGMYLVWGPGLAIMATVLAFNVIGEGLNSALDAGRRQADES